MAHTYKSKNEKDTQNIAKNLASFLCGGDIVFLRGNLGAGKTAFARALIQTLMQERTLDVPSPTYTLVQTYDTPKDTIWHFDLYRIRTADDVYELGWEEALYNGISLIEWPERLENLAPTERLDIVFTYSENNKNEREISFVPHGKWVKRLGSMKE